ncbi:hypothetical protein KZZ52_58720 [Dactylosporangium sp. AC04546]|uniref:hypothetical protein n=1 Tax=Dactylosporangium sp. AC04546 TaxID=2862460 RepID=UPI001EE074AF|nr:hypothetical protein [Dactylosporangium sp. AC04546]WVK83628.1 hypothetical protein KZZ52_58720 [Dactylosporangium sp. AC04546]
MAGTPLERLCAHRGVPVPAADQVLDLAPVLDMRPADLLAIAGGEIPARFMPAAPEATDLIDSMLGVDGPPIAETVALRDFARSLPRSDAGGPAGLPPLEPVTSGTAFTRLLAVRNISRRGMAYMTGSSFSTVAKAMGGGQLIAQRLDLMAAVLCLPPDDFDAMMVRAPDSPPADDWVQERVPPLWVLGELLLALAPLTLEQIQAVQTFARRRRLSPPHPSTP